MPSVEAQTWSTSSDLLSQVRRRDQDAWRRFVLLYAPLIYCWSRRAGVTAEDAADLAQDVFARVLRGIDRFRHDRPGDTLRGWLRVIWRSRLTEFVNRRNASPVATGGSAANGMLEQVAEFEDDALTTLNERHELVRRAADLVRGEFEDRSWRAFLLIAVEHRSAAEAATELGMTVGAVRQAKYVVRKRLREELAGEDF